ncbi:MAG: ferritin-like domain-containing protein [Armatimonadota bacterium]
MRIPDDPKEVIKAAMDFEADGYKIFVDAGEKSTDPLSKATFNFLRDQELTHIERIKKFAAMIEGGVDFDLDSLGEPITVAKAKKEIGGIFKEFKSQFEATAGDPDERMEVYTVAMKMECRGHDFYGSAADAAKDEVSKKIYRFLSDEEAQHYMIIEETQTFLMQPDAIMAVEERWMQF